MKHAINKVLQNRIEEAAEKHEQCYNVGEEHGYLYTHKGDIKEAVIYGATLALQNQWISVEEALPEIKEHFMSEDVLCKYSDGSMGFDYLKENIFGQQRFEHECEESVVTHWMLIPQLKGGEQ